MSKPFECWVSLIISEGDPGVHFAGGAERLPQPQQSARLFPLTRVHERNPLRVELRCTRTDEHGANGQHWHDTPGGYRMTWDIPEDTVWMAS